MEQLSRGDLIAGFDYNKDWHVEQLTFVKPHANSPVLYHNDQSLPIVRVFWLFSFVWQVLYVLQAAFWQKREILSRGKPDKRVTDR